MEHIRQVKIIVYVDTNKRTVEEDFGDIDEAKEFLDELLESINP